ncbi:MAG: endonuclease III [Buchnera aphidicola (Periphyllus lyropictus)]|uniref:endonuclease III n=1 Tax=Buchnera aphidicola TaxID=9 RepID=UPI001EB30E5C|nr:endonuclease III [Buchnera aphidicola]NIH16716.1 endonuclease III [Buchnera aphidicola (Periphyllus lyropictus)]USS94621.1 endonuclease III [Buchnera aphidicola (Periphyllus lyropictus)]
MNKKKRLKILNLFKEKYGLKRKTELFFSSPFELLISVILSAQTRDKMVNSITKKLFNFANTPKKMILLGKKKLIFFLKKIGLFRTKANNIIKTCKILLKKYNGFIPNNRKDLESLPGVGRKTANVILNIIFKKNTIAVDTHVFRVSNRTGFATAKNPKQVELILLKVVPIKLKLYLHTWFVFHGKNFCMAKKTKCKRCIINKLCEYKKLI